MKRRRCNHALLRTMFSRCTDNVSCTRLSFYHGNIRNFAQESICTTPATALPRCGSPEACFGPATALPRRGSPDACFGGTVGHPCFGSITHAFLFALDVWLGTRCTRGSDKGFIDNQKGCSQPTRKGVHNPPTCGPGWGLRVSLERDTCSKPGHHFVVSGQKNVVN